MPTRSNAFDFAASIQHAAAIVTEGTAMFTAEELAGQYAADAAIQSGYTDAASLATQLDYLADAGAKFDTAEALSVALRFIGDGSTLDANKTTATIERTRAGSFALYVPRQPGEHEEQRPYRGSFDSFIDATRHAEALGASLDVAALTLR